MRVMEIDSKTNNLKQRYVMGGLFCEKIFGPSKSWTCYCGCYKNKEIPRRIRLKKPVILCSICQVEVTDSKIRNYRMGYCDFI